MSILIYGSMIAHSCLISKLYDRFINALLDLLAKTAYILFCSIMVISDDSYDSLVISYLNVERSILQI